MSSVPATFASELVAALKLTAPIDPQDVARRLGLGVELCDASGFEGALVCSKETRAGTILVKNSIRESSRRRFTIAHEIGHYVLPHHGSKGSLCGTKDLESWDRSLPDEESEANDFASELLIPRSLVGPTLLGRKPTFHLIREICRVFDTSLTASGFRTMQLTSFRGAIVWSTAGVIRWFKASEEFMAFVSVKDAVAEGTYAYDCFRGLTVPDDLKSVRAELWLAESKRNPDYIQEHSIWLPSYDSVLTLLYIEESSIALADPGEEGIEELDPNDFTVNRGRWPR
jgi:hypothetical protein